ncbi:STAS-like domain-containing protein [Clostridioides difficile]|nr:STAS-like domain-containing protein [Clostridioides difficile]
MIIKFLEFGKSLGTRQLGKKIRTDIINSIKKGDKVIFDFNGVSIISNSFADECFGKILEEMDLQTLVNNTEFKDTNDNIRIIIKSVLRKY